MKDKPYRQRSLAESQRIMPAQELERSNVFTVSQLNSQIKQLLEGHYRFVWVKGEISNFRMPASGHCYFTLKDEQSQIRAVLFRVQQRTLRFAPEDGIQVVCQGRISVYEPRGEYQLIIDVMEPLGFGQLQLAFEQLKKKLDAEGLFDPQRKKPLPVCPQRIALVTSATGAAIRDILKVLQRAPYPVTVTLCPVRVQGVGAAGEIADAIDVINGLVDTYQWDVVIVGRGGGSLEDLWSFNEEIVARAMARTRIPIISAVGHEIDWTIADLVADSRAPTPTAAAEWAVTRLLHIQQDLRDYRERLLRFAQQRLESPRQMLNFLHQRLLDPRRRLADLRLLVDDRFARLHLAWNHRINRAREDVVRERQHLALCHPAGRIQDCRERLRRRTKELYWQQQLVLERCQAQLRPTVVRLQSLNPLAVLERGYSITYRLPEERIVTSETTVKLGQRIRVQLAEGSLECSVERKQAGTSLLREEMSAGESQKDRTI